MRTAVTYGYPWLRSGLAAAVLFITSCGAHDAAAMDGYRFRKRPLLVFSPTDSHPSYVRQKNAINGNRIGVSDREMVVIYIVGNSLMTDFGPAPRMSASAIRSRYRVSEGQFRVLQLGKDGDTKRDSLTFVPLPELLAEIDRMPMRRDEIRRRSERQ